MDWFKFITAVSELATVFSCCCTVPITIAALFIGIKQLKDLKRQLKQTTNHIITSLSIEHNWQLFEQRGSLPALLKSWTDLSEENKGWAWRILLLNHLNLLYVAYQDHKNKTINDEELRYWKSRAKYWFAKLSSEEQNPEINEGRKILKQLLSREEAIFTDDFRTWLGETSIVPAYFILD